jgi:CRP/FNR family transcriptional regulator, cyclic AMP receptor protein
MATHNTTKSRTTPFFKKLASQTTSRRYLKGEDIYLQGEAANSIFRIERGNVKLTVESKNGKKAVISILRVGDCFGESCLFGDPLRRYTATSIDNTTVGRIDRNPMLRRLRDEPAFASVFVAHLLQKMMRVEDDLVDQLVNSSERRLARLLMRLSNADEFAGIANVVASVDQGTMAQMVGTTRSRVSHFMNGFRKKGMIAYNGDLQVNKSLMTYLLRTDH